MKFRRCVFVSLGGKGLWYCENNTPLHMKYKKDGMATEESRAWVCEWSSERHTELIVMWLDYLRLELSCGRRKHVMSPYTWKIRRADSMRSGFGSREKTIKAPKVPRRHPGRFYFLRINLDTGSMSFTLTKQDYDNDMWAERFKPGNANDEQLMDAYLDYLVGSWCSNMCMLPMPYWRYDTWRSDPPLPRHVHFLNWNSTNGINIQQQQSNATGQEGSDDDETQWEIVD